MSFAAALEFTLRWEGGVSNDPDDPGGLTYRGVTQATYDAYRRGMGLPRRAVTEMADDELRAIYSRFWREVRGDEVPAPLNAVLFDFAVNAGARRAIRALQAVGGLTCDGIFGPVTMAYVRSNDPVKLAARVLDARAGYYVGLCALREANEKWLRGWLARVHAQRVELGL